jgi:hypothetical protein
MTKFHLGSEAFVNESSSISQVLDVSKAFQLVVQDYVRIALVIAVILFEICVVANRAPSSSEVITYTSYPESYNNTSWTRTY